MDECTRRRMSGGHCRLADGHVLETTRALSCWPARQSGRDYAVRRDKAARDLLHSAAWRAARAAFLVAHPTCTECRAPAMVVDHRDPYRGDPVIVWGSKRIGRRSARHVIRGRRRPRMTGSAIRADTDPPGAKCLAEYEPERRLLKILRGHNRSKKPIQNE